MLILRAIATHLSLPIKLPMATPCLVLAIYLTSKKPRPYRAVLMGWNTKADLMSAMVSVLGLIYPMLSKVITKIALSTMTLAIILRS